MHLDSSQLHHVSSSRRDVFIMALTSNPFQILSCLYLHLLHSAALPLIGAAIVKTSCNFVTATAAPPQHLHFVPFDCTSVARMSVSFSLFFQPAMFLYEQFWFTLLNITFLNKSVQAVLILYVYFWYNMVILVLNIPIQYNINPKTVDCGLLWMIYFLYLFCDCCMTWCYSNRE